MKKTVAVILLLTTVTVFFCVSVSAADYQTVGVQTGTYNNSSHQIVISTKIVQLYSHIDSQPIYEGSAYVPFLYTTMVTNNSDQNKLVQGIRVAARYQNLGTRYLSNIENMGSDLFMSISTMATAGWFDCVPSATFSVENAVLVPAHRTLYCVAVVYMECEYIYNNVSQTYIPAPPAFDGDAYVNVISITDGSGYDFFDPGSSNTGADIANAMSTYIGDPSQGDVIDYLSTIHSDNNTIIARLNTIISALNSWTGSTPTYSPWTAYQTSATMPNDPINDSWCTLYAQPSFEFSADFEKLTNNTSYFNYNTVIPVQITYYYKSNYDGDLLPNEVLYINSVFKKSNGYSIVGGTLHSNFASVARFNSNSTEYNLLIYPDIDRISLGDVLILTYDFYIVYSDTNWTYWQTGNLNCSSIGNSTMTDDSINDKSTSIVSQSNVIHQQEQAWFNQNSQALQSVGLNNYNWGNNGNTGVVGVSNDFTDLFNSLGAWNTVYIFSMTLTVALTIIRYSVRGSRRRRDDDS